MKHIDNELAERRRLLERLENFAMDYGIRKEYYEKAMRSTYRTGADFAVSPRFYRYYDRSFPMPSSRETGIRRSGGPTEDPFPAPDTIPSQDMRDMADAVLERLKPLCPEVVLAGGAPRDWILGKTSRDLDIYLCVPPNSTDELAGLLIKKTLGWVGEENRVRFSQLSPQSLVEYGDINGIQTVFVSLINGIEVQFIVLNTQDDLKNVLHHFDADICMVTYKDGQFKPTPLFINAVNTQTIHLSDKASWGSSHARKLREKFSTGFTFSTVKISQLEGI